MLKFGIAFSGGGYRAATYHIGVLRALRKLHILDKVDVLTTNSGGSITGAYYLLNKDKMNPLEIEESLEKKLSQNVILYILFHWRTILGASVLCGLLVLSILPAILFDIVWMTPLLSVVSLYIVFKFQFALFPFGSLLEKAYRTYFFGNSVLCDLGKTPEIVINSTNLDTGKLWIFNQKEMKDTTYEFGNNKAQFNPDPFPISRAVAASSCVPFAFTPIRIDDEFIKHEVSSKSVSPRLVDGGVYDNQGIHKLTQENSKYNCKYVLVSDAGYGFPLGKTQTNIISVLIRVMEILMLRIKNQQMISGVFENSIKGQRQIGYFSLGWEHTDVLSSFVKNFKSGLLTKEVIRAHELETYATKDDADIILYLKNRIGYEEIVSIIHNEAEIKNRLQVSTNLVPIPKKQSDALMLHGEVMSTLFIKLHCPGILT